MNDERRIFLSLLGHLPARLTAEKAAWVLNCQAHDIPTLVAARLLKPLGHPSPNSIKFFAASDVLELAKDRNRLGKVTTTINEHWQRKNADRKSRNTEVADELSTQLTQSCCPP